MGETNWLTSALFREIWGGGGIETESIDLNLFLLSDRIFLW